MNTTIPDKRQLLEVKVLEIEPFTSIRIKTEIHEIIIFKGKFDYIVDLYYNNSLEGNCISSKFFPLSPIEGFAKLVEYVLGYIGKEELTFI